MRDFIDALAKTYKSIDHVVVAFATALIALLFLFMFSEIALSQNKFFGTPNRGVEGARGNAQIKALNDSTSQNRQDIQSLQNTIDTSLTTVIDDVGALQAAVDASLTAVSDCGNLGMIGGPDHATANAQDCLPSLVIGTTGETVFSEPTRHQQGLVLGDNPTCDAGTEGMLRYISAQKSVMLCTGTTWIEVGAAPAASGVFTPVTNANLEQVYTSNSVALSGFFGTRTATATNGATIVVNGVSQGTSANVEAGDSVALRMTSSATYNTAKSTTLSLSSYNQTWTVTTKPQDTTPNPFSFTDLTDQELGTLVMSNSVTVTGFDGPLTVSVSGEGNPQLQVAGGAWASSAPINAGESLRLRMTTSASYSTPQTVTVVLGSFSASWSTTTSSECESGQQVFTSPGSFNFVIPDSCTVVAKLWGAGGGGGGRESSTITGGGGAFAQKALNLPSGSSIYVRVGGGGSQGNTGSYFNGGAGGGASSIHYQGNVVAAAGGGGGAGAFNAYGGRGGAGGQNGEGSSGCGAGGGLAGSVNGVGANGAYPGGVIGYYSGGSGVGASGAPNCAGGMATGGYNGGGNGGHGALGGVSSGSCSNNNVAAGGGGGGGFPYGGGGGGYCHYNHGSGGGGGGASIGESIIPGNFQIPGNTTDIHYAGPAGRGGLNSACNNGRVVIVWD